MRTLEITGGETLVSDQDYEELAKYAWRISFGSRSGKPYVKRDVISEDGKKTTIFMHRSITGCPRGLEVDHRDRDGLNNQRGNLVICSGWQNRTNRIGYSITGFKGVSRHGSKFRARICFDDREIYLGAFVHAADAARAYDAAAFERFGEFAYLNFREEFPLSDLADTF